jgi:glutamate dehydrogenase (NADP+)
MRKEATGYGLVYITAEAMRLRGDSFKDKVTIVSGSGNVAIYACEKAQQLGAKVVAMYDSNGYIYDPNGIQIEVVKQLKEVERARIKEYADRVPGSKYVEGCKGIWSIPCDVALPCATQNEIDKDSAELLVKNGVKYVSEGANMPSTLDAIEVFQTAENVVFLPAKAANAGGVATSALEMAQSSGRLFWSAEEVDAKLKTIMINIYRNIDSAAKRYGFDGNYVMGANIAGFEKVAEAMMAHGIV